MQTDPTAGLLGYSLICVAIAGRGIESTRRTIVLFAVGLVVLWLAKLETAIIASVLVFLYVILYRGQQRGKLFQFDLNVRRVLSYDAPVNSAGIKKVYEVTGWTTESKAWLYVVLTAHLPAGMPTGPDVNERVTFAGYFLKVQGYHAAGAGPRDKPLAAPLLIGRMTWNHPPIPATSAYGDGAWGYWPVAIMLLLGVAGLTIWLIVSRQAAKRRATTATSSHPSHVGGLHDWLASAQRGTMDEPTSNADFRFHDN